MLTAHLPAESADAKLALLLAESEKAFNAELSRKDALTHKAERYLAAAGILTGFYLADIVPRASLTYSVLLAGALTLFAAALISVLLTLRVRKYRSYPPGAELLEKLGAHEVTVNAARFIVSTMYCEAQDLNAEINNQRARLLAVGGALMTAGFVLAAASHLLVKL